MLRLTNYKHEFYMETKHVYVNRVELQNICMKMYPIESSHLRRPD